MKEQVVIQAGTMANLVGTHYWNVQQEYDNEVVDHAISFADSDPLLLSINYRGLAPPQTDYDPENTKEDDAEWQGKVTRVKQAAYPYKNFQSLYYNTRSLNTLPRHYSPNIPFCSYSIGRDVLAEVRDDLLEDNLRYFIEACDSLQSFTVLADVHDAFSGLSVDTCEYLRDEFPKTSILSFGFHDGEDSMAAKVNSALAMHSLSGLSDIYVPLYSPKSMDEYKSSALMASLIESITFPTRQRNSDLDMYQICNLVNSTGNTGIASLAYACVKDIPSIEKESKEISWLNDLSLRRNVVTGPEWGSLNVLRGFGTEAGTLSSLDEFATQFPSPPNCSKSILLKSAAFPVVGSFPKDVLLEDGMLFARLSSRPEIGEVLVKSAAKDLERLIRGFSVGGGEAWTSEDSKGEKGHASTSHLLAGYADGNHGMGKEDFQECVEDLYQLASGYEF